MENQLETTAKAFELAPEVIAKFPAILTEEAVLFLTELHEVFNKQRLELLEKRKVQQQKFDDARYS